MSVNCLFTNNYKNFTFDIITHLLIWVFLLELLQDLGHVSPGLLLVQILLIQIQTQWPIQEVNAVRIQHLPIHLNVHLCSKMEQKIIFFS